MQFLIGLVIGIVVYISAYFIITAIKKKKSKKNYNSEKNDYIQK